MTSQPKAEDLTLPEPARTLLSRTRGILDTYVTPRTPDRSGWTIGGGTILAARWRHRESRDIDLLVHPRTETRFLQASPVNRRLLLRQASGRNGLYLPRSSSAPSASSSASVAGAASRLPRPRLTTASGV